MSRSWNRGNLFLYWFIPSHWIKTYLFDNKMDLTTLFTIVSWFYILQCQYSITAVNTSVKPSKRPTKKPSARPTRKPSSKPTKRPTKKPSTKPTRKPSSRPSKRPTKKPSTKPTKKPTTLRKPTKAPVVKTTPKPIPPTPAPSYPPCSCAPYVSSKTISNAPITKMFDRIVIFVMEDTGYDATLQNAYMKNLTQYGALFTSYYSCQHPSYPNYLNLVAAQDFGSTSDNSPDWIYGARTIVDVLDSFRYTWKNYMEPRVDKENDPFSHFYHIMSNSTRKSNIVPSSQFYSDWKNRALPTYSLYVASRLDGEPAGGVPSLADFLNAMGGVAGIQAYTGTLVQIVYDEDDDNPKGDYCDVNHVYNLFLGSPVKANCTIKTNSTPYTVLRTIEDNFKTGGIGNVGNFDRRVSAVTECWAKKGK